MSELDAFLAEHKRQKEKQILASGESFNEWDVICPYCTYEQQDVWDWGLKPNDENEEVQCQSCERHFMVKASVRYSTRRLK